MAHQVQEVAGTMSEDVDDDDRRLFECTRKYEIMAKQIDELKGIMKNYTSASKLRKTRNGSTSGARAGVSASQPNRNRELVQTLTRFLQELEAEPADSERSRST